MVRASRCTLSVIAGQVAGWVVLVVLVYLPEIQLEALPFMLTAYWLLLAQFGLRGTPVQTLYYVGHRDLQAHLVVHELLVCILAAHLGLLPLVPVVCVHGRSLLLNLNVWIRILRSLAGLSEFFLFHLRILLLAERPIRLNVLPLLELAVAFFVVAVGCIIGLLYWQAGAHRSGEVVLRVEN